jgi:hypothetical protein
VEFAIAEMIRVAIPATLIVMSSHSLQDLGLKAGLLKAVAKKARHEGKTLPEYVRWLIERGAGTAPRFPSSVARCPRRGRAGE